MERVLAMKLSGAGLFMLLLAAGPAGAQNLDNLQTMVSAGGSCPVFSVGSERYSCSGFVYTKFRNGRVSFTFPMADTAISFSGGRDSQPSLDNYVLFVDAIRISAGRGEVRSAQASGRCRMNASDDGLVIHSLSCIAETDSREMRIEFRGDGKPVNRRSF